MRTTLDIDDDILAAAKDLAKAEGRTMGQVISDLARMALTQSPGAGFAEPNATFVFDDWPTFSSRSGMPVTNEMIRKIQEEVDLEDATAWDHDADQPRVLEPVPSKPARKS